MERREGLVGEGGGERTVDGFAVPRRQVREREDTRTVTSSALPALSWPAVSWCPRLSSLCPINSADASSTMFLLLRGLGIRGVFVSSSSHLPDLVGTRVNIAVVELPWAFPDKSRSLWRTYHSEAETFPLRSRCLHS